MAWSYLDVQVQVLAESLPPTHSAVSSPQPPVRPEDPTSEWARAKTQLRAQVAPIPFANWIEDTRQLDITTDTITIGVADEPTVSVLTSDYAALIEHVALALHLPRIAYTILAPA
jgi:hypothetical protein